MPDRLFVYGTLHPDRAPAEIADVMGAMRSVGKGTIRARRFEFGDYPGVVIDDKTKTKVVGEVFALPSDPSALARLDEYEEYDPEKPHSSLFRRKRIWVTLSDGRRESCWVYLYNRPVHRGPSLIQRVRKTASAAR